MKRLVIAPTAVDAARVAAAIVVRAVARKRRAVLALPTGRTAEALYDAVLQEAARRRVRFGGVTTFNLDEFADRGAGGTTYRAFLTAYLVRKLQPPPRRTHFLNGRARNWRREVARYERAISRAGGLDLCVLGLGTNGHIAFNEPGRSLPVATGRVRLARSTRRANASAFGGDARRVPRFGLTMGVGTLLGARTVLLLATGQRKRIAVRRALTGPITTAVPASLLQLHPNVLVVIDRAAAGALPREARRKAGSVG
jgi:glucosamine-6-phosphate deaminase